MGCGTAYHAGLIGRYAIEEWARVPVEMDIASEYRYRNPVVGPDDLVIGISQSGETADTLAAMRLARERGARVLAVTNTMGSQATRDADGVAVHARRPRDRGRRDEDVHLPGRGHVHARPCAWPSCAASSHPSASPSWSARSSACPTASTRSSAAPPSRSEPIADAYWQSEFFLYIGRHVGLPVALEGALKLKEISYIATDAYAAGEMKHGPIALLDDSTPVVCVATDSPVLEKVVSNMQEVRARGAHVIAIATEGNDTIAAAVRATVCVPPLDWMLQPMLAVMPLQLLAYKIARRRGLNVDQPRNLAKTVTVE